MYEDDKAVIEKDRSAQGRVVELSQDSASNLEKDECGVLMTREHYLEKTKIEPKTFASKEERLAYLQKRCRKYQESKIEQLILESEDLDLESELPPLDRKPRHIVVRISDFMEEMTPRISVRGCRATGGGHV